MESCSKKYEVLMNLIICLFGILIVESSYAQTQERVIEEIVVTAQKREQNLNDVSVAVTAFSGEDVRALGLAQPVDLAAQTPNLNINNTFQNTLPNISIRGIGLNDYAVNNNPATGVYIDEVYLVSPAMLGFQLFDMERVEVIKGPQGTLFGKNTTAGAVNFVSAKPTEALEGYLSLDAGNYNLFGAEGAFSGEIASGLMGRFAFQTTQQHEGHIKNRATGRDVGSIDRTAWRASLNWTPTESADIFLSLHSGTDTSDTWLIKVNNSFTTEDDLFFPGDPNESAGRFDTFLDNKAEGAALTVNWDLSEQLLLTSVSAYETYERHYVEDRDGTALIHLDGEYLNDIAQYSQELRLTYQRSALSLIAGVFYGTDEVETRDRFDAPDLPFPFMSVGNEYRQETDSAALFAHLEWLLSDNINLTAGLRYTDEEKEFSDAFTFLYLDAIPSAGGTQTNVFPPVHNNYDVTDVSGKISLDYRGFEDTLLYFSASKGFKSGAFQGQLTFTPSDLSGFDEENVFAYELGVKRTLINGSMQINAAAFFYDYEDIQIYGPIFDSPVGPLFGITNAGDAELVGGEIELLWLPAPGLEVRTGLGLIDSEITDSILATVAKGSELPNAPETNFNLMVRYEFPLTTTWMVDVLFDTSYKDDVTYDIVRAPEETKEDAYWVSNARIGLRSNNERWGLYLWGRNLSDKEYRTQIQRTTIGFVETYGMPRTYGITLDVAF